jgi:histidine triad (HIT) family protein
MFHHEPPGYDCPLCAIVSGRNNPLPFAQQSDVVLRTEHTTALINSRWWPNNAGHVLVVPNAHVENIYDLVAPLSTYVQETVRQVALGLKHCHQCDGISTRQHNEPAGYQEVWHYHVHVFPRYTGDGLYALHDQGRYASVEERASHAAQLRAYLRA